MPQPCDKCKALCCQYFCFEIDEPDDYEEFEDIRWYLCHDGVSVHIEDNGDWYIQIENRCLKLDEDNRCTIYEDRPLICRSYGDDCEITGNDYGYIEDFKTPEQLDAYARKTLGDEEYEKQMIKHRAKLEGISKKKMRQRLAAKLVALGPGHTKTKTTKKKKRKGK
jgi:Fe-S-cluster containining protein